MKKIAELAARATAVGGEGPIWDHRTNVLCWLDITTRVIHTHNPETGENTAEKLPHRISRLFLMGDDEYAAAVPGGIARLYKEAGIWTTEKLLTLDTNPDILSNDGECDSRGRLVVGLMHKEFLPGFGSMHIVSGEKVCCFSDNLKIPNGVAWSVDEKDLYVVTDHPEAGIMNFEYDIEAGMVGELKKLMPLKRADGMCGDENGNLWVTLCGGGAVICYNPKTQKVTDEIKIPVSTVTSCAFGGENLDTLYITSATWGNSVPEVPLRGSLFKVENMNVRGKKSNIFRW